MEPTDFFAEAIAETSDKATGKARAERVAQADRLGLTLTAEKHPTKVGQYVYRVNRKSGDLELVFETNTLTQGNRSVKTILDKVEAKVAQAAEEAAAAAAKAPKAPKA